MSLMFSRDFQKVFQKIFFARTSSQSWLKFPVAFLTFYVIKCKRVLEHVHNSENTELAPSHQ